MFCYYLMHTSWCIFLLSEFINSKLFINMNADSFADQLMNSKLFINMNLSIASYSCLLISIRFA
jgi:hypothetical protein